MQANDEQKLRFNLEEINAIPIKEVLEAVGGRPAMAAKNRFHCFNGASHSHGDRNASMTINPTKNTCTCHSTSCGMWGDPIAIAKHYNDGDFIKGCEWLHEGWKIPYLDGKQTKKTQQPKRQSHYKEPEINYIRFDSSREYRVYDIDNMLEEWDTLDDAKKYACMLTVIYQESLRTDRRALRAFYDKRGIPLEDKNFALIGYIPKGTSGTFWKKFENMFGIEALIHFGLYKGPTEKWNPCSWKFGGNEVAFVPSFDLYSNLITGAMLRPFVKPKTGQKEFSLCKPDLLMAVPFALTREILLSDRPIFLTEGHIDGLSLGDAHAFAASPGTNGLKEQEMGLLEGKDVYPVYDMDRAGLCKMLGYFKVTFKKNNKNISILFPRTDGISFLSKFTKQRTSFLRRLRNWCKINYLVREVKITLADQLIKAGAKKVVITGWDPKLGSDVNELLISGNLKKENLKTLIKKEKAC